MLQAQGQLEAARADVERDRLNYERITNLISRAVESRQSDDNARLALAADRAADRLAAQGNYTWQNVWTVRIQSPLDGVVLEKLVIQTNWSCPESFGGGRGPSTALLAVAD